ncbi:nucleoside-diphosphate sugar epimerase/dehydratase [uncultured Alistipes sp.]|uniref:polysaccharide biosynthesis protein n=2 Tax=Alistipes TaxID=239759 RepID=UPI00266CA73C|nr:nucleoside-diphosphate sugar epimerase/dehydratase [uncultured Alistipes sp.]
MQRALADRLRFDKYLKSWLILIIDVCISSFATIVAAVSAVAFTAPDAVFRPDKYLLLGMVAGGFSMGGFFLFKTYRSVIRHSTLGKVWKIGAATVFKVVLMFGLISAFPALLPADHTYIYVYATFDLLLSVCSLITVRVAMILSYDTIKRNFLKNNRRMRIVVYGVNDKAVSLVSRLQNSPHYNVCGFIVHGSRLRSYKINDLPIYYFLTAENVRYVRDKYDIQGILFPNYDTAQEERERLIQLGTRSGIKILIAPPIDDVTDGKLMKANIREIKIEDLLGRPEIKISLDEIIAGFRGKTILVTGAAGSIGSELCRQLATFGIRRLVLFDNAETPMHNIRLELEEKYPDLEFVPVIGDVRLTARLDYAFRTYRPQIVFHAAAYKHVPLMEENPCEAVLVNVVGTRNVADHCMRYGIEKMVMISTDKAVNPTNIMGASKRLAEIYVQSFGQAIAAGQIAGGTKFVTTRFGNVLGSNGSVIPRFREQIEKGGPVTVTHPDIVRFFMTIPEACRLVMEAATMSGGNEIFVFDMGESIRIADLARRMIELAGLKEGEDIKIEYTGLRPGEKLYEEVLSNSENTLPTPHDKIRIAQVREYDYHEACRVVSRLEELSREVNVPDTVRLMKQIVPEYKSQNSKFCSFDGQAAETTAIAADITA